MALVEMAHPLIEGHGWIDAEGFPEFAAKGWTLVEPAPTDAESPRTKPARRPAVATTHSNEKE